jgi:hypothetical protein
VTARNLLGLGRRLEREAERSSGLAPRDGGEPIEHLWQFEEADRAWIHAGKSRVGVIPKEVLRQQSAVIVALTTIRSGRNE